MTLGEVIKAYRQSTGCSMDDFAKRSGISKAYISILERNINPNNGKPPVPSLEKIRMVARTVGKSFEAVLQLLEGTEAAPKLFSTPAPSITDDVVTLPVLVEVAAGYNQMPLENWEGERIEIPRAYLHRRPQSDYFAMRVRGDSMYPDYRDGDVLLVLKQSTLNRSGEVGVVVYGDNEATLKKVEYVQGEDWLKLIPINPQFPPRTITGVDLEQCCILGVPTLLLREL